MMTKRELAEAIVGHHLYSPAMDGVNSPNYYRFNPEWEIKYRMRTHTREELQNVYDEMFWDDGTEKCRHECGDV